MTNCPPLTRGLEGEGWGDFREKPTPQPLGSLSAGSPLYEQHSLSPGSPGSLGKEWEGC